jgi:hypothetical protein
MRFMPQQQKRKGTYLVPENIDNSTEGLKRAFFVVLYGRFDHVPGT